MYMKIILICAFLFITTVCYGHGTKIDWVLQTTSPESGVTSSFLNDSETSVLLPASFATQWECVITRSSKNSEEVERDIRCYHFSKSGLIDTSVSESVVCKFGSNTINEFANLLLVVVVDPASHKFSRASITLTCATRS